MYTLNREVFRADVNCLRIMERLGWMRVEKSACQLFADTAQALVPPTIAAIIAHRIDWRGWGGLRQTNQIVRSVVFKSCAFEWQSSATAPDPCGLVLWGWRIFWGFMQAGCDAQLGVGRRPARAGDVRCKLARSLALQAGSGKQAAEKVLSALSGKRPDIVIAGPPCRGLRRRAGPRNPDDPRNEVLRAAVRVAVRLQPKVIVVENVMYLRGPAFMPYLRGAMGVAPVAQNTASITQSLTHQRSGFPRQGNELS